MIFLTLVFLMMAMMLATLMALAFCNPRLGKWACSLLGWHLPPENPRSDGTVSYGICPRCGKSVLQDSQGNWF